ncbi:MAG: hydrogenase formation protein HypD [Actinobacteria bacterium RBG_19FT_COMBO_36_27]|nr:MAG: hydrogenase formation protein HypD [Actinobacteria bacterium RBG_19FT_COMBO_36_27]
MKSNIKELVEYLNNNKPDHKINIMEVCGTHTMAISRYGLRQLIPETINLISGPGCPVCVTPAGDIDWILEITEQHKVSLFTFGDMLRVPGTRSSLYDKRSEGRDINICYSPADALDFARNNPGRKVIFIAIGFETTVPLTSLIIKRAYQEKINNFYIYNTHKLIPEALELLLLDKEVEIDAFLCPGHVSAIIGSEPYDFIAEDYRIPCVISGFEPMDILESIVTIIRQISKGISKVEIQYRRVVREEGNPAALKSIYEVFDKSDSVWRGLGNIPGSGLKLKKKFLKFDAKTYFPVKRLKSREPSGCECGDVLKGIKKPAECKLFSKICKPENPVGPCMVSSEGSCAAYYKYEKLKI